MSTQLLTRFINYHAYLVRLQTSSFAESHATEKEVCTWVLPTNACRRVDFFAGVSLLALLVVLSGLDARWW